MPRHLQAANTHRDSVSRRHMKCETNLPRWEATHRYTARTGRRDAASLQIQRAQRHHHAACALPKPTANLDAQSHPRLRATVVAAAESQLSHPPAATAEGVPQRCSPRCIDCKRVQPHIQTVALVAVVRERAASDCVVRNSRPRAKRCEQRCGAASTAEPRLAIKMQILQCCIAGQRESESG